MCDSKCIFNQELGMLFNIPALEIQISSPTYFFLLLMDRRQMHRSR